LRINVAFPWGEGRGQMQQSDHHEDQRPRIAKVEVAAMQLVQQEKHADSYQDRRTRQAADRTALATTPDLVAHGFTPLRS